MSFPQGNGHERDFMGDKRVYIMDVYNRHIYPGDRFAKRKLLPINRPDSVLCGLGEWGDHPLLCSHEGGVVLGVHWLAQTEEQTTHPGPHSCPGHMCRGLCVSKPLEQPRGKNRSREGTG